MAIGRGGKVNSKVYDFGAVDNIFERLLLPVDIDLPTEIGPDSCMVALFTESAYTFSVSFLWS